ncbi:MAG: hypothetical protein K940chlam1_01168 [Candidatus Anoxychlamydiales bacterium]|nr:hypothetical protein [Candidatus Anoxychlamydiales bacterium]NGX35372.1 hypothetical protein [Candidatus Anoxychlamydiales bacterium]
MAVEPSIPDYKRTLINNLDELKQEFKWCLDNPQKVDKEKIADFKRGVKNLRYFTQDKITDEKFIRDIERFDVLIGKLPTALSDIEKETIEMIFERIEKLINDLG